MSTIWILGAPDAEMTAIENLLRECGQSSLYGLAPKMRRDPETGRLVVVCDDGGNPVYQRVAPGQAAAAAGEVYLTGDFVPRPLAGLEVVAIEVAGPWGPPAIDHHDEHPLASAPPREFMSASSLGQVISQLAQMGALPDHWLMEEVIDVRERRGTLAEAGRGWFVWLGLTGETQDGGGLGEFFVGQLTYIPRPLVFEAAADHCPAAAVAGQCPGVDPVPFSAFLAENKRRQYFPWMSPEDFARELSISRATLLAAPPVTELCDPHPASFSPDLEWVYLVGADPSDCPIGTWVAPGLVEDDGDGGMGTAVEGPLYIVWYEPDGTPVGVVATPKMLAMRDLRHLEPGTVAAQGSGEMYPAEFLVGIVAALFEGIGFVCRIRRGDGKLALRSNGHGLGTLAGTRPAEVFLADPSAFGCGPRFPAGQDASYGNPIRGFFGGTLI